MKWSRSKKKKKKKKKKGTVVGRDSDDTVFVCIEGLRPNKPIGVMSSAVSLPNQNFSWAGLVRG